MLPFPDAAFDRVVASFALMFFRDRAAALAEMRRVAAAGGRVALSTWAGVDHSPGYRALVHLLDRVVGAEAADALRAPFVLGDEAAVRAAVEPVLGDVTIEARTGTARFASLDAWLHTEIRGWVLAGSIDDPTFERLRREARTALGAYADARTGRVAFPAPALLAVADR